MMICWWIVGSPHFKSVVSLSSEVEDISALDVKGSVLPQAVLYPVTLWHSIMSQKTEVSIVSLSPHPQAGAPMLFSCLQLFIQYICRYPVYLRAVPFFCILMMCLAMVTGTHLAWI
jgi:hypothetical protein